MFEIASCWSWDAPANYPLGFPSRRKPEGSKHHLQGRLPELHWRTKVNTAQWMSADGYGRVGFISPAFINKPAFINAANGKTPTRPAQDVNRGQVSELNGGNRKVSDLRFIH